ncbi:hypothetical protein NE897_13005 [Yersinia ruckeri]|uniref:Uncharacterized protein n=1 Tax=Yersinia ruckeri TaxID=29486 RepID=A0A0A8V8N4_YERRU|nr:hypothetical protein [Yersinia ruckeri]EEP97947.1 hypothetical protein yruck0001_34380 [Yersinia ruckeri ATCC 29473]EKN3345757.1 hypothetical protein [Yersinia ruckeri]EKN4697930.1 hypothetical protein [Yersinia ruckeri]EKN4705510.1 hypothetical protein [Yersinia ruckeri]KGA44192.1 hypothetical protein DJ39_2561 [Yersinia ruckeri ATCC 29473]
MLHKMAKHGHVEMDATCSDNNEQYAHRVEMGSITAGSYFFRLFDT